MKLQHAIVHLLHKVRNISIASATFRDSELDCKNKKVISLISQIRNAYNTKNGLGYGDFINKRRPFEDNLFEYKLASMSFITFSKNAMDELVEAIKHKTAATGGYIIFSYYKENDSNFLLIAMLKNKGSFNFDADLNLVDLDTLDLDHLHIAARINLEKWASNDEKYISFIKGRSDDVMAYFKSFLGINDDSYSDSKENTGDLYRVVLDYCESRKYFRLLETEP